MTDPIADMLTRIRNKMARKEEAFEFPSSSQKVEMAKILKEEGFIKNFEISVRGNLKFLRLVLKYSTDGKPVISHLRRVSKPGRRVYLKSSQIIHPLNGLGLLLLSTSKGIMTDKKAKKLGFGGEVLCELW